MRVRSAAALHGGDLLRIREVADIEDADAAEPVGAGRRWRTARAPGVRRRQRRRCRRRRRRYIPPAAELPCVPQSVRPFIASADMNSRWPYTETSPCPPGQRIDVAQLDLSRIVDVVEIDAVVVADEEMIAAECQVGVGGPILNARSPPAAAARGAPACSGGGSGTAGSGCRSIVAGRESRRLGQGRDAAACPNAASAGVVQSALQSDPRIVGLRARDSNRPWERPPWKGRAREASRVCAPFCPAQSIGNAAMVSARVSAQREDRELVS